MCENICINKLFEVQTQIYVAMHRIHTIGCLNNACELLEIVCYLASASFKRCIVSLK